VAVQAKLNQDKNNQQTGGGQAPATAAPSTQVSTVNPYSGATTTPTGNTSSGRFTNISSYLNANKGAGEKIATQVGSNITKQVDKTQEQTNKVNDVASAVNAEKDRLAKAQEYNAKIQENPNELVNDETTYGQVRNLITGTSDQSKQQQDASAALSGANTALNTVGQKISGLGNEAGRFNVLGETFARPSYSQGQKRLDQLLFSVGGAQQLADTAKNLQGQVQTRQNQVNDLTKTIGDQLTSNATALGDASTLLGNTLNSQQANLIQQQTDEAKALNAKNADLNQTLTALFSGGFDQLTDTQKELAKQELAKSGLGLDSKTYNVLNENKYRNYLTEGATDFSAADVLDDQELARYQALARLQGMTPEQYAYTQAGSNKATAGLKGQDLQSAIKSAEETFNSILSGTNLTGNASTVERRGGFLNARSPEEQSYTTKANAMALLQGILSGQGTNVEAQWSQGNQVRSPITYNMAANGPGQLGGIDWANVATASGQDLWNQFQNILNQQGYSNTLGGIKPSNGNFGVS